MTARDEILAVLPDLEFGSGDGTFSVEDVVGALRRRGVPVQRAHDSDARHLGHLHRPGKPQHAVVYDDLERVERGRYRRRTRGDDRG